MNKLKVEETNGRSNQGFSLLEVILGLLIFSLMASSVIPIMLYSQQVSLSGEDKLAAAFAIEKKFIDLKKNPSLVTLRDFGTEQCVTDDPCPAVSAVYPACPVYEDLSLTPSPSLGKSRCFYYKVEDVAAGLPITLKKVTGRVYWSDRRGAQRFLELETTMQGST